jgi:hypothetical protein
MIDNENKPNPNEETVREDFPADAVHLVGSATLEQVKIDQPESTTSEEIDDSELENSAESPIFIQEPTLEKTLEKIKLVPKEKRKIIVYAGVHPNEGTAGLAEKYADEWSARFGVLVVCQPTEQTPNAIWEAHREKISDDYIPPLSKDVVLSETAYEDQFSQGDETFFIRFHGTPLSKMGSLKDRKLDILTSMYETAPNLFTNNQTHSSDIPLRHSKPEIVQGLDKIIPDVKKYGCPANVIVAEYCYEGDPTESNDPYVNKLMDLQKDRYPSGVLKIFEEDDEDWFLKGNIEPDYLTMPKLNEADERAFEETFLPLFEKMLKHLANQL